MTWEIGYGVRIALLACLAGLWWRRRYGEAWSFVGYAIAIMVCGQLTSTWSSRYFTYTWYLRFQAIYNLFKLAIALELGYRVFHAFPRALARFRAVTVVVLAVTTYWAFAGPFNVHLKQLLFEWEPRVQAATVWLMTAEVVLIVWHHLPVSWFDRAILLGFVPYLTTFETLLGLLRRLDVTEGWPLAVISTANSAAYLCACAWWAYAAWRPDRPPAPERSMRLQPA